MATITYAFIPGQEIWVITSCGIKKGTVVQVLATETTTLSTLTYDVLFDGAAYTNELTEADIFATKADALAEYDVRLG